MKSRSIISLTAAALVLLFFSLSKPISPITPMGMRVVGIFISTMILWLFEGIGYPSILAISLLIVLNTMSMKDAFALSLGNNLAIFIIAAFGLAEAMRLTGFARRFAFWFVSRPFTAGRPWVMISMFLFSALLMGCFTSGSATCVTLMPIAESLLVELGYKKGDHMAATLMTALAWSATVAFVATPIGHGSNLMFIDWIKRDTGYAISFPLWIAAGFPLAFLMFLMILAYFRFIVRPDAMRFRDAAARWVHDEGDKLGPMRLEEKIAFGAFIIVVVIWLAPGFLAGPLPKVADYLSKVGVSAPALIASCLLCVISVKNKPVLTFKAWMTGVPWETFALLAAIYSIADVLGNPATGISAFFSKTFAPLATGAPFFVYRALAQIWVLLQTNLMSNTVSATTVYQALMPTAIATKIGNPVALGFAIWFGARAAFATPPATTNTALVTGSGWVPIPFLIRHGVIVSLVTAVFALFVVYPWTAFIFR